MTKEALDNQIISYFYSGLSIADISKKMKESICKIDSHIKSLTDAREYVSWVIYYYQLANQISIRDNHEERLK